MKKLIIVFLIAITMISCNEGNKEDEKVRYTQDSEEINALKAVIKDYENADWDAMKKHYADTAQIYHNSSKAKSIDSTIADQKRSLENISSYGFVPDEDDYEMVVTDDGHTWVNYWGDWTGTFTDSDKKIIVPVHLTARFVNGKIVREHGYWDGSIGMIAQQELAAAKAQDSIEANE